MNFIPRTRRWTVWSVTILMVLALFGAMLTLGQVEIPLREIYDILVYRSSSSPAWTTIVLQSRFPMALTALLAGATLSVSGLMLQTTFRNPLAGPSILGISSGASLGVAVIVLLTTAVTPLSTSIQSVGALVGALLGAGVTLALLTLFSALLRNSLSVLIIGILVSYLSSSFISMLNIFAPPEAVRSFVVWGMGSFAAVTTDDLMPFAILCVASIAVGSLCVKPLDSLLLGDRYMRSMGYNVTLTRTVILVAAGLQTAVVTAYCGPIGFIGLIVPHIARMALNTSSHRVLYPVCAISGAIVALFCALVSVMPRNAGVIPINAVTPLLGVPIIVYIMLNTKRLNYLN